MLFLNAKINWNVLILESYATDITVIKIPHYIYYANHPDGTHAIICNTVSHYPMQPNVTIKIQSIVMKLQAFP